MQHKKPLSIPPSRPHPKKEREEDWTLALLEKESSEITPNKLEQELKRMLTTKAKARIKLDKMILSGEIKIKNSSDWAKVRKALWSS